ncbi:hypothetical protein ACTJIJ_13515 [Niabella sp. 22666]|uniref:hypothetical protein n=1 Tax=Niabella sp. 22666 TaxID=3453954 RepID=UPI003F82B243
MKTIVFCCLSLVIWSCNPRLDEQESLNCPAVNCIPGDGYFAIKLIDKTTGADLILNKGIDTTGIRVINNDSEPLFVANRMGIDSLKTAIMFEDHSKEGSNNISIKLKAQTINFSYQYNRKKNGCCTIGNVQNLVVESHEFAVYGIGNYPDNFKAVVIKF